MLILVAMGVTFTVQARTDVWDGTAVAWTRGDGTQTNPYLIETAENLAYLAAKVNNGAASYGIYYKLTADIDLAGSKSLQWTPIGYTINTAFAGNFDGNGHTISNLVIESSSFKYAGLFGYAYNATIATIGVTGHSSIINTCVAGYCGAILGYGTRVTISACYNTGNLADFSGSINYSNNYVSYVGGIVGYGEDITVSNCYNTGNITTYISTSGGIYGYGTNVTVSTCYNTGTISKSSTLSDYYITSGGIAGNAGTTATLSNCYNTGNIMAPCGGGIAGSSGTGSTIVNCKNTGNIVASSSEYSGSYSATYSCHSGGILGNGTATISDCTNEGSVSSSSSASNTYDSHSGGIAGYGGGSLIISNCKNTGSVSASTSFYQNANCSYSGGIVGDGSGTITISNSLNTATISSYSSSTNCNKLSSRCSYSGGIIGNGQEAALAISECYNTGKIDAYSYLDNDSYYSPSLHSYAYSGGIAGNGDSSYPITILNCYNAGTITSYSYFFCSSSYAYSGGIIGYGNGHTKGLITIANCYNIGHIASVSASSPAYPSSSDYAYSGGIAGYIANYQLTDCYFSTNCGSENSYGLSMENSEMRLSSFVDALNNGLSKAVWKMDFDEHPVNNGFPILIWQEANITGITTTKDSRPSTLSFKIYPNPAERTITFEVEDLITNAYLTMYDINGKEVLNLFINPTEKTREIDLSGLSEGLYMIKLASNNAKSIAKLMIR